ncbi:MAG: type IV-A pilus assembly ATPase PilB [bacterium]|jgi:type IV pilus assembly protein PilB|nr:type IV-A pilus assembly ATPase PilB [bacterium]MDD3806086.1 type IV-A pilus assembly ATPase PilB [bacterium]MDD4557802.1 type IV-A pilus assembly ATPase PilB [bacterium]
MANKRKLLGEILVETGVITDKQLQQAISVKQKTGEPIGRVLVDMGMATEKNVFEAMGKQLGVEYVDMGDYPVDPSVIKLVPLHIAQRYKLVPINRRGNKLTVAMVDPLNIFAIDDVRLITGYEVEPVIASEDDIMDVFSRGYKVEDTVKDALADMGGGVEQDLDVTQTESDLSLSVDRLKEMVEEAPIIRVVNTLIMRAIEDRASDIHVEPEKNALRVRYRVDGVLHDVMSMPKYIHPALSSRIKIMADLNIAERRIPQDGRIHVKTTDKDIDLRVSSLPTIYGEKIVMRILDKSSVLIGLNKLGFLTETQALLEDMITKPNGMILVTGPTGSGKTTTLYSILQKLNSPEKNIITIEDPVEYQLQGINQVQVNYKAGLTFANALKSFLRQDPDIIMVGEIRDLDTAEIAVHAALTGHLVLSTLHTNDAPTTISRLIDMGVEPFLVASSVIGVLAQRLARVICPECKTAYKPPVGALKRLGVEEGEEEMELFRGDGCELCRRTGYKGRVGIYEMMPMTEEMSNLTLRRAPAHEIKAASMRGGMTTLQDDGLQKVMQGMTTFDEIMRVVFIG